MVAADFDIDPGLETWIRLNIPKDHQVRLMNCLVNAGRWGNLNPPVRTVEELRETSEYKLLRVKNLGKKTVCALFSALNDGRPDLAKDIATVEKFIFEELVVSIQSAEPEPNPAEEDDISEAKSARIAFLRIKERMGIE